MESMIEDSLRGSHKTGIDTKHIAGKTIPWRTTPQRRGRYETDHTIIAVRY